MKIVFFGSPASALPPLEKILEAGHSVELAITQPDKPRGRGQAAAPPPVKEFALGRRIPVLQPEKIKRDPAAFEALQKINPDVNVVVAYGQIIPACLIYLPRFKSVNVHFSLLPKYRGAAPVEWAIRNGEDVTGITIIELNEKMDEGDILASEEVAILPRETASQLEARLAPAGAGLLVRTIAEIEHLQRRPQDHAQATYAPRLKKEDGKIDWARDALSIDRMVRAFVPWPRAFTFFKGQRLIIHAGRPIDASVSCQVPGQIVELKKEGMIVCCGKGSVYLIERLQRENKKEMDAAAFLRGTQVVSGDSFE